MILADKLNRLRTMSGLSQEELAEKLNVSRQSVSKWESGSSMPSIDKIVELSKIYGVSTDYLLNDEEEQLPSEIVPDIYDGNRIREISLEEANDYVGRVWITSKKIALGVALCIISPVLMFFLLGLSMRENPILTEDMASAGGVLVVLVIIAGAVALFLQSTGITKKYEFLENEEFKLAYTVNGIMEKEAEEYTPTLYRNIAIGVAFILVGAGILAFTGAAAEEHEDLLMYALCALLILVAIGVNRIVLVCTRSGAYDRLLQRGDYTVEKKSTAKNLSAFSGAYWMGLTALYLAISFLKENWDRSWIVWPVGAVLFAGLYAIAARVVKGKK